MKRSRCRDRPQPPPPPPPAGRREDGAQRAVELPQPQPLPPRRRAPPGRQLLEERTGLSGPEVREQVRGPDGVREGKDGEREPEWEQWGRGSQAGRLGLGHLRGGDCVVCGEKGRSGKAEKWGVEKWKSWPGVEWEMGELGFGKMVLWAFVVRDSGCEEGTLECSLGVNELQRIGLLKGFLGVSQRGK